MVLLPAPVGHTNAIDSPFFTEKETFFKTGLFGSYPNVTLSNITFPEIIGILLSLKLSDTITGSSKVSKILSK